MTPAEILSIRTRNGLPLEVIGRSVWYYDHEVYFLVSERATSSEIHRADYRHLIGDGWVASTVTRGGCFDHGGRWTETFRIRGNKEKAREELVLIAMKHL